MQKGFRIFSIILAILLALYFSWSRLDRKPPAPDVQLTLDSLYQINAVADKGNLVGISPYMIPEDYASPAHFQAKLDAYLQTAVLKGWLTPKSIVLFPEYIGTWLIVAGEKRSILTAPSVEKAMTTYISSNIFSFLRNWFMAPDMATDKIKHSVFASKSERMARVYQDVFSRLADKYKVTIVAGSILLQNPVWDNGRIRIRNGPLYNVSGVFNPDGSLQPQLIKKSFPIQGEQPFIMSEPADHIPSFALPAGQTTVMICADAWFPEPYENARNTKSRILLVPSYTEQDGSMNRPWNGYSGYAAPLDTDSLDIGKISLREAWTKYTLPGRIKYSGASYGLIVPLRGKLWDLGSDGEFLAVTPDGMYSGKPGNGASMVSVFLK